MKFKHLNCPACGRQLINLNTEKVQEAGLHHFWCAVCNVDIDIDENIIPYDEEEEEEEEDSIPWNEWLS